MSPPNSPLATGVIVSWGKLPRKQRFELQLLHLALQLLRALLGFALQLLDLLLHAEDRLLLLLHLQQQPLLGLGLGARLDFGLLLAHALFDGKVKLALFLGQLALLAHGLGLRLLRFGELGFPLIERFGQLFELLRLVIKIDGERGPCFLCLLLRNFLALGLEPVRDLRVDGFLGLFNRLLLRADRRLALGDLLLLLAELRLAVAPRGLDQRRGKRLGELDLGPAIGTNDRRFQAQILPGAGV